MTPLTAADYAALEKSYLTREIVDAAKIQRVDTIEGAQRVGRPATAAKDYAGLVFSYFWPGETHPREYRLRRDNPDLERRADGSIKEKNKYLNPPGKGNQLYIPPDTPAEWLTDLTIPATITEGEKKALALWRFYRERSEKRLVIGLSGVWNFRGTVGNVTNGNGKKQNVSGIIPDFDRIEWEGRKVLIVFDINVLTDESVAAGRRELSRELQRRGATPSWVNLPTGIPGVNGVDDLLAKLGPDFVAGILANPENSENSETPWEMPAPFREYDLPPFPTDALSSWQRSFVEQLTEEAQTPVDLAAMQTLSACATCVARNVEIEARNGWREPLNIFTLTVIDSANRKSKVVADVVRPLEVFERDLLVDMRDKIAEAENERKIIEARLEKAQKDCAKLEGAELAQRKEEARELAIELASHEIPAPPRLFVDDTTSEALITKLFEQGGRIGMFSAEGGVFETMAGRYSQGAANIDVYLKGHSGDSLRVDRSHRSERVERPALTIGLAVQSDVLRGLAEKPGFRGRGLLGRFLYSLPPSKLGRRKSRTTPVTDEARRTYERYLIKLAAIKPEENEDDCPITLKLAPDADGYLAVFQEEIEPELAEDGEYSSLSDWAGKLCGAVLRLAGIIHLADHAANAPNFPVIVSANTLKRAITIGRYLIPHAQAAYAEMGADPLVEDAKYILRWLGRERPEKPTRRDIHQGTKGRFKTVVSIDPVIELLVQHGYLRPVGGPVEARRGRKASQPYEINPYFLDTAHNSHNSQKWASNGIPRADSVNFENSENSEKGSEGAELEIDLNEDGEDF